MRVISFVVVLIWVMQASSVEAQKGTGKTCSSNRQCNSRVCTGGVCQAPTCTDGKKNGKETAIDCGGPTCPPCGFNKKCGTGSDCKSRVCTGGKCQKPTCTDGVKNGKETGKDCGGPSCPPCPLSGDCKFNRDCNGWDNNLKRSTCFEGRCISCSNGKQDGFETDVDCGGMICRPVKQCALNLGCIIGADCSGYGTNTTGALTCVNGRCVVA